MPILSKQKITDKQKEYLERLANDSGESISSMVRFCINFSMEVEKMKGTKKYPDEVN